MKKSKIILRVLLVLVGAFAVFGVFSIVQELYCRHFGESAHEDDTRLCDSVYVHRFGRGRARLYNGNTDEYFGPVFEWVAERPETDSLTAFCDRNGKRGYLNVNTGEIAIEAKYEYAWTFCEGLAAVLEPGGKLGFIDQRGEYVIAPELDYWMEQDYRFENGLCLMENEKGMKGMIDRNGNFVLPMGYDAIISDEQSVSNR